MRITWILLGAVTSDKSSAFLLTPRWISGSTSMGSDISETSSNLLINDDHPRADKLKFADEAWAAEMAMCA